MRKSTLMLAAAALLTAGAANAANYTLDPVSGSVVDDLSSLTVTFEGRMGYNSDVHASYLENVVSGEIYEADVFGPNINGEGNAVYTVSFYEPGASFTPSVINQEGSYVLSLRGFGFDKEEGDEMVWDYIDPIIASYAIYPREYTLNPENGQVVKDLANITLTFPGNPMIGIDEETNVRGGGPVVLENVTTGTVYYCQNPTPRRGDDGSKIFDLTFSELGSSVPVDCINEAGVYMLTVRGLYESTLQDNEEELNIPLPDIQARYEIVYPTYTVDPVDGSSVGCINEITVTFEGRVGFTEVRPAVGVLENLKTGEAYYCYNPFQKGFDAEGNTIYTLSFYEVGGEEPVTITEVGDYQLTLKGFYYNEYEDEDGDTQYDYFPTITLNYTIPYPVAYKLNPESDSHLTSIKEVVVEFAGNVGMYEGRGTEILLENTTTGNMYAGQANRNRPDGEGNVSYTITFLGEGEEGDEEVTVTEVGDYVLRIAGLYTSTIVDGEETDAEDLPVITANYTIDYPVAYTLDPENGTPVEDLSKVTITFAGRVGQIAGRGNEILLENTTTGAVYTGQAVGPAFDEEGNSSYTISFYEVGVESAEEAVAASVTAVGHYTLRLGGFYQGETEDENGAMEYGFLPVITAEYDILYPVNYILSPANDSHLTSIREVVLDFQGRVGYTEGRGTEVLLENTTTGNIYPGQFVGPVFDEEGNASLTITFTEQGDTEEVTITELGDYILRVAGLFTTTLDENGLESEPVYLPVITANYSIVYPVEYTLNPVNGSHLASIKEVVVEFPGNVGMYEGRGNEILLENTTTGNMYAGQANRNRPDGEGNVSYTITFLGEGEEGDEEVTVTEVGDYVLRIAGLYTSTIVDGEETDAEDLPVITANYTIDYPVAYTLDPENGASVEDLSHVTITFAGRVGQIAGRGNEILLENTTTGAVYTGQAVGPAFDEEGNSSYTISFYEVGVESAEEAVAASVTAVGNYTLRLSGFYQGETEDENGAIEYDFLPAITAEYEIPYPVNYILSPANDSHLTSIKEVVVEFAGNVGMYEGRGNEILLENTTTGNIYAGQANRNRPDEEGNVSYTITFLGEGEEGAEEVTITELGDYVLRIAGLYTSTIVDGEETDLEDLPVITANYSIVYPVGYTLYPASGSHLESIFQVEIQFEGHAGIESGRGNEILLENTTTGDIYIGHEMFNGFDEAGNQSYIISFTAQGEEGEVEITEVGEYVLRIGGVYTSTINEDGEESEPEYLAPIVANYTIDYPVAYRLVPESGSQVEDLSKVYITFEGRMGWEGGRGNEIILENTTTGDDYQGFAFPLGFDEDGNATYEITFYELGAEEAATITALGDYTLRLGGFFNNAYEDVDGEMVYDFLPALTAKYQIAYPVAYYLNPEDGSQVDAISKVYITFEGRMGWEGGNGTEILLENTTTGDTYQGFAFPLGFDEDGNATYEITFYELGAEEAATITAEGEYTLRLGGFFNNAYEDEDGEMVYDFLPAITANYSIVYPVEYTLNPESGSELETIENVTVTFANDAVGIFEDFKPAPVILENLTTGTIYYGLPMRNTNSTEGSEYTITFSEQGGEEVECIMEEGTYQLTIYGIFVSEFDAEENQVDTDLPNITATYYVVNGTSGIQNVIDSDVYNVYGINGIQMIKNGNAESLKSLNPGLYIINGKKVIIRK